MRPHASPSRTPANEEAIFGKTLGESKRALASEVRPFHQPVKNVYFDVSLVAAAVSTRCRSISSKLLKLNLEIKWHKLVKLHAGPERHFNAECDSKCRNVNSRNGKGSDSSMKARPRGIFMLVVMEGALHCSCSFLFSLSSRVLFSLSVRLLSSVFLLCVFILSVCMSLFGSLYSLCGSFFLAFLEMCFQWGLPCLWCFYSFWFLIYVSLSFSVLCFASSTSIAFSTDGDIYNCASSPTVVVIFPSFPFFASAARICVAWFPYFFHELESFTLSVVCCPTSLFHVVYLCNQSLTHWQDETRCC